MKSFRYAFLALLASAALHLGSASAQPWPSRTVRWIVPLGAGSGADVTARLLAEQLSSRWRQPIVIENKPGADGMLGLATFVNAADDHTLLFAPTATFIVHPFLHERMPYDPAQLLPLARVSNTVIAMAVPASKNYRSLKQLIEAIRASPGRMHWTGVTGTDMVFAAFLKKHDLTMPKVPYRDTVQAINDLSEARIDLFVAAFTTVQAQLQAGRVSLLAVTNKERTTLATDVPTAREAGFPDLTVDGLAGLFGTRIFRAMCVRKSAMMCNSRNSI